MQTYESTPLTTLGSILAIIAIFAWLYGFYKVYSNYKENKRKQSLYFSLGLLFGGSSIICLAFELVTLQLFDNGTIAGQQYVPKVVFAGIKSDQIGLFFSFTAIIISATAILFFDIFSLSFFENKMKFIVIPFILLASYALLYIIGNPVIVLNQQGTDYNPVHNNSLFGVNIELILVALFLFPLFFPAILFFFSAIQGRSNKYNFRRALVLCLLQIMIGLGYTIEIVGGNEYLTIIGRILIICYPYMTWLVLQNSKIVKKILREPI